MQANQAAASTAVVLDDATVAFRLPDARVYTAVEKVQLAVVHGEFVAIVGPTGCGKSTLLNIVAGLASVVREGVTGYLVDGHETAEWADRILRLLNDPENAEQMGRRGVLLAQRFPWDLTADRVWAAMEPLVVPAAQDAARPT